MNDDAFTDLSQSPARKSVFPDDRAQAAFCHYIRRRQQNADNPPVVTTELLLRMKDNVWFPSLPDQLNNLIRHMGNNMEPGEKKEDICETLQYVAGASKPEGVLILLKELEKKELISYRKLNYGAHTGAPVPPETYSISLTFDGWARYEEIKRGVATGRKAFMAMPFNTDIDDTWLPVARDAVKATGFDLRRVDDQPEPGIIDNIMRVQIEEARFVVVELTNANLGAYWEAGYAEGLQKPVIYTCQKGQKVHFDTSHLTRIEWEPDKLDDAAKRLKAMIRHTLPDALHEE